MTLPLTFEGSLNNKIELPLPPDLLRRFVTCPHYGIWSIAGVSFHVETNSEALLHSFSLQQEANASGSVRLKVVVDDDLPQTYDADPFLIDSGQLCWGSINGLLFAFDRAAGESFIFLPAEQVLEFRAIFEELLRATEPIMSEAYNSDVA